jgi:hypothetical protein
MTGVSGRVREAQRKSVVAAALAVALVGCGQQQTSESQRARVEDPGPIHVHGLGVNPADGSLFVATHTGLFRAAGGELHARRVGGRFQDTMGFAVVGADRFLGSGHPDLRDRLPPFLGLIESRDAGETWRPVSLLGKVDFHVLEARGQRIYGYGSDYESRTPRFLTSADGGRRWERLDAPEALVSLAIAPTAPSSIIVSGDRRVLRSDDAGRSWRPVEAPTPGLLAWTADGIFVAARDGRVWRADHRPGSWRQTGSIGGEPAAFDSGPRSELLIALHDGTIKMSTDGGATWPIRSKPR